MMAPPSLLNATALEKQPTCTCSWMHTSTKVQLSSAMTSSTGRAQVEVGMQETLSSACTSPDVLSRGCLLGSPHWHGCGYLLLSQFLQSLSSFLRYLHQRQHRSHLGPPPRFMPLPPHPLHFLLLWLGQLWVTRPHLSGDHGFQ